MANIVITNAGLVALVNAEQSGTNAIKITSVQFGTGKYTPSATQTSLQASFKTLTTIASGAIGDNVIHVEVTDHGTETYTVYEYGLFLEDGTLFGVYSQNTPIISKAAGSSAMLAVDCVVQGATPQTVAFGGTNFSNPTATSSTVGVVELATSEETIAGTDSARAVTPAGLSSRIATTSAAGLTQYASIPEAEAGEIETKSITPKTLWKAIQKAVTDIVKPLIKAAILAAVPIGVMVHYSGTTIPEGYLLCNGASLSRTEYPELFEVIGTKIGAVDSAHFNIPDLHHRFLEGTTVLSEVLSYIAAGLPNIQGITNAVAYVSPTIGGIGSGAFSGMKRWVSSVQIESQGTNASAIQMDASLSDASYGGSSTVQVAALRGLALIRAY